MENNCSLMAFFCSTNSKKIGKATFFFCSLKSVILRTRRTRKTRITFSTKQVFSVFCFQEQKTVLENINQTDPMFLSMKNIIKKKKMLWATVDSCFSRAFSLNDKFAFESLFIFVLFF